MEKIEILKGLTKKVEDTLSDSSFIFFNSLLNRVKDLSVKLESNEVMIPLVGEFSSGKSSLLNALLGQPILPTDILPTTFTINEVRFSCEKDRIEIFFNDERKREFEGLIDLKEINYSDANLIRIYSTSRVIPPGIVIVDAPGLSSGIKRHEEIIRNYVPRADGIFLVIDVNQGSITKSTENFLKIANAIHKKIYLILTKSDLKSPRELEEIKKYAISNYPFTPEKIAVTSTKENKIEEFINLIKDIHESSSEILAKSITTVLKPICEEALKITQSQISAQNLDTNDIDLEINKIKNQIEQIRTELNEELEKVKDQINTAIAKATEIFKTRLMGNVGKLVDIAFSDEKNKLEEKFDEIIKEVGEEAVKYYQKLIGKAIDDFSTNLKNIADRIDIGSPTAIYIGNALTQSVLLALFIALPGSWIINVGERILVSILLKIPQLKSIREIVEGVSKAILEVATKSFVKKQIEEKIQEAVQAFREELDDHSFEVKKEIENNIRKYYKELEETYIQSLETLKQERSKQIDEYRRYLYKLATTYKELEKIIEELNDI